MRYSAPASRASRGPEESALGATSTCAAGTAVSEEPALGGTLTCTSEPGASEEPALGAAANRASAPLAMVEADCQMQIAAKTEAAPAHTAVFSFKASRACWVLKSTMNSGAHSVQKIIGTRRKNGLTE